MNDFRKDKPCITKDRIVENRIILDGKGHFPKELVIILEGKEKLYRILKTRNDKFILNV